jgi:hypothetical protein
MKRNATLTAGLLLGTASVAALADSGPFLHSYSLKETGMANSAQLVVAPRLHREVEVDRTLAAQPVHAWMAQVQLGGQTPFGPSMGAPITTWIDPLQRLDGNYGLDSDHSLVKAQRLWITFHGVDANALAAISNASMATRPRADAGNHAQIVAMPTAGRPDLKAGTMRIFIPNAPRPAADPKVHMARAK